MEEKRCKDLLIIIPAYNEEKNIGDTLEGLKAAGIFEWADILVMNDASKDRTEEIVRQHGCQVVTHVYNLGYGSGLQIGYKYAVRKGYEYVIQMDADGQHDACNIPAIYRELKGTGIDTDKADIVLGSRFMEESSDFRVSLLKKWAYAMFRFLIRQATGRHIADPTTGLQGLGREAFLFYSEYNHFDDKYPDANMLMQMLLLGYRVREVPAVMHARGSGQSMHSGLKPGWYMLRMLFSMLTVVFRIKILRLDLTSNLHKDGQ